MKPFFTKILISGVIFFAAFAYRAYAQSCATIGRLQATDFVNAAGTGNVTVQGLSYQGWSGAGAGTVTINNGVSTQFNNNTNSNQTFSQQVNNANLTGAGATINISIRPIDETTGNGNGATLRIRYNGTLYATVFTPTFTGSNASVSYANGASGNITGIAMPMGSTSNWSINLPANIANSGVLSMQFTTINNPSTSDDITIFSVNLRSCPVPISGTVRKDMNGATGGVNGTGTGTAGTAPLYVNLTDSTGNVLRSVAVATNGTYSVNADTMGAYTVRLSTTQGTAGQPAPAAGLPPSWQSVSEQDGSPDMMQSLRVDTSITLNNSRNNLDFGISRFPIANNDSNTTMINTAVNGNMATNDSCGNASPCIYNTTAVTAPANGTVAINTNGTYTYTPATGFTGTDSFAYAVCDANDSCSTAMVFIVVGTPLPVHIKQFAVSLRFNHIGLYWTTDMERNNKGFAVERSTDDSTWSRLAFVPTEARNGNSFRELYYSYEDRSPVPGNNFYRLMQQDLDGNHAYSAVRMQKFTGIGSIAVYPNPAQHSVTISGLSGTETIYMTDVSGKVVKRVKHTAAQTTIDISSLAEGLYQLHIVSATEHLSSKLVKLKS